MEIDLLNENIISEAKKGNMKKLLFVIAFMYCSSTFADTILKCSLIEICKSYTDEPHIIRCDKAAGESYLILNKFKKELKVKYSAVMDGEYYLNDFTIDYFGHDISSIKDDNKKMQSYFKAMKFLKENYVDAFVLMFDKERLLSELFGYQFHEFTLNKFTLDLTLSRSDKGANATYDFMKWDYNCAKAEKLI